MSATFDKYQKRRLRSSYFSVVLSISIVLFMVGILGLVLLKASLVANKVKEKVAFTLFLKDAVKPKQIDFLIESIRKEPYTNKLEFIDKETAAKNYSEELGEDFLNFLGTNPLKNGIDIYLKAEYVTPEKLEELEKKYLENVFVADVLYDKPLISILTRNIQKISFWMLIISSFFAFVAILLINSSIRLSIYSKRFNIKTMQMVGATKSFIRKPFILTSIKLGIIAAFIAIIAVVIVIYYIDKFAPSLALFSDYKTLLILGFGIITVSLIISWISTFFAAQRFLNLHTDELYY